MIKSLIQERDSLKKAIKDNNARNRKLRKRINEIENNIKSYLVEKEQPGVKYENETGNKTAVIIKKKNVYGRKGDKQKTTDCVEYLKRLGISNPEKVYENVKSLQKKEGKETTVLQFKKIKK